MNFSYNTAAVSDRNTFEFKPIPIEQPSCKRRALKWVFILVLISIAVFSLFRFGIAYQRITVDNGVIGRKFGFLFFGRKESAPSPTADPTYLTPEPEKNRIDILVMGIRGEQDREVGGFLADSILVISYDTQSKKNAMVSIPRDLFIKLPGSNKQGKINSIYALDLEYGRKLEFAKDIVSRISGVYIDHAIVLDMIAFQELVDALGGITITLSQPFEEPQQWGYPFRLEAGTHTLDGEQAMYYVRSRFSTSDFDRARRQQQMLLALKNKVVSLGVLANPLKINELLGIVQKNIRTDIGFWELSALIKTVSALQDVSVNRYIINTDNVVYESRYQEQYILLPKNNNLQEIKNVFQTILH